MKSAICMILSGDQPHFHSLPSVGTGLHTPRKNSEFAIDSSSLFAHPSQSTGLHLIFPYDRASPLCLSFKTFQWSINNNNHKQRGNR